MTAGGFNVAELDDLLDRVRFDLVANDAKQLIRRQFLELVELLTPAEGSPINTVAAILAQRCADEGWDIDEVAAQIVGALGMFPRYAEQAAP